ncbi:TPA: hypothetical protein OMS84_003534 [Enterobacter hormaechei]|nr:hypothetical protein [Enterobacter hormaechei]HCR0970444.1 hypothetical protein [Enterobacter hormaechei]
MNNQQTMLFQGMQIPRPVLNVDLNVLPDFTGRVVLHIENGRVICDRRLRRILARKREMEKWCAKWDAMHERYVKERDELKATKPAGVR